MTDFLHRLRVKNIIRCEDTFKHTIHSWNGLEWAGAVCGEAGELANVLKKERRGEPLDMKALQDEIADVAIYLDLLAASYGIDLEQAITSKFNEVSRRRGSSHLL